MAGDFMNMEDIHPETMITAAELLGNLSALTMPFNVQNLAGNWLTLAGQAILTFNAQQQYFAQGAGKCYQEVACQKQEAIADNDQLQELQKAVKQLTEEIAALKSAVDDLRASDEMYLLSELCRCVKEMKTENLPNRKGADD